MLVKRADGADDAVFDVFWKHDVGHGHIRRVQMRCLHKFADFSIKSDDLVEDATVHIHVVVNEVQGRAVCPGRRSHFDDAVLDE